MRLPSNSASRRNPSVEQESQADADHENGVELTFGDSHDEAGIRNAIGLSKDADDRVEYEEKAGQHTVRQVLAATCSHEVKHDKQE